MVGVRFSKIAEQKSAELADSLVRRLLESPRTAAYRCVDENMLREDFRIFFVDLTEWLLYRTTADIEEEFTKLGRRRASQGIPIEQGVNVLLLCRDHLVGCLRQEATQGNEVELFGALEFVVAVNQFCDDAIYFSMKGQMEYEHARQEVA